MAKKVANKGLSKNQKIVIASSVIILGGLFAYLFYRKNKYAKLKAKCIAEGGTWDESTKTCIPKPLPEPEKPEPPKIEKIAQNDLLFKTGSSQILSSSFDSLNKLADWLKSNSQFNLSLVGHTDSSGSETYNLKLSKDRAKSVKTYLESKGVQPTRIISDGKGESEPIASNDTAEGRQKNRRVVFTVN